MDDLKVTMVMPSPSSSPELVKTIEYTGLIALCLIVGFHTIGFVAICLHGKRTTQNLILCHLSSSEMLLAISYIIRSILVLPRDVVVVDVFEAVSTVASHEMLFIIIIMTIDRLCFVSRPDNYHELVTSLRIKICICTSWILSVLLAIAWAILKDQMFPVFLSFASLLVILFFVTTIIMATKKINQSDATLDFLQEFSVWFFIVVTFLGLYMVPIIFRYAVKCCLSELSMSGLHVVMKAALCVHPVIYVFMDRNYRENIISKGLCVNRGDTNDNGNVAVRSTVSA